MLAVIILAVIVGVWLGAKAEHRANVIKIGKKLLDDDKGRKR